MVTTPRRAAGSPVVSSWLRLLRCTKDNKHHEDLKNLLPTLDIGSHSNATLQARLAAGARHERTLLAVACTRLILIEAPSSAYPDGMLILRKIVTSGGDLMRFYTAPHPLYCGIDLHARTMYGWILDPKGESRVPRHMQAGPAPFLPTLAPEREELVVCVACIVPWYWPTSGPAKAFPSCWAMPCICRRSRGVKRKTTQSTHRRSLSSSGAGCSRRPLALPQRGGRRGLCSGAGCL